MMSTDWTGTKKKSLPLIQCEIAHMRNRYGEI